MCTTVSVCKQIGFYLYKWLIAHWCRGTEFRKSIESIKKTNNNTAILLMKYDKNSENLIKNVFESMYATKYIQSLY